MQHSWAGRVRWPKGVSKGNPYRGKPRGQGGSERFTGCEDGGDCKTWGLDDASRTSASEASASSSREYGPGEPNLICHPRDGYVEEALDKFFEVRPPSWASPGPCY